MKAALLGLALAVAPLVALADEAALENARSLVLEARLPQAVDAYSAILARSPSQREPRLERARALAWLGRHEEALADLDLLLARDPDDAEASIARARLLGWMGRPAEGEAELLRVLEARPTDVDALLTLEDLRRWQRRGAQAHAEAERPEVAPRDRRARLDVGLQLDALDGDRSDWWHADTFLSAPVSETVVLRGGVDQYRRFDESATQATLGALWTLPEGWSVDARATTGFDTQVVARTVVDVELARSLGERLTSRLRGRYSRFAGDVDSIAVSPGLEFVPIPQLRVAARYYLTRITGGRTGHSGSLQLDLAPEARLSPYAFGAFGSEVFAPSTVDQDRSRARILTLGAGLRWRIREDLGLRIALEHEDLRHTYERLGAGAGLFVRF